MNEQSRFHLSDEKINLLRLPKLHLVQEEQQKREREREVIDPSARLD